jgi:hypothetical protein
MINKVIEAAIVLSFQSSLATHESCSLDDVLTSLFLPSPMM